MTVWVADTNLLLPSSSRRLLLGLPSRAFAPVLDRRDHNDAYIVSGASAGSARGTLA